MHSDLIGKIEKARHYAQEPERVDLGELKATFRGGNSDHMITLSDDKWSCDCRFFRDWDTCSACDGDAKDTRSDALRAGASGWRASSCG